jgi:hypothetical protein
MMTMTTSRLEALLVIDWVTHLNVWANTAYMEYCYHGRDTRMDCILERLGRPINQRRTWKTVYSRVTEYSIHPFRLNVTAYILRAFIHDYCDILCS